MKRASGRSDTGFQPAAGPQTAARVERFLLDQGWAGVSAGQHLHRLASTGVRSEQVLWWLPGPRGEVEAVALLHQGLLGFVLGAPSAAGPALEMLSRHRRGLERLVVPEGAIDLPPLDGFMVRRTEVTVAGTVRCPLPELLPTRRGGLEDADQLHEIYQKVSWMRREGPEAWRERLADQPCWVAEIGGRVVAAARWTASFGSWVEVGGVATHPDFRRRGAATAVTYAAAMSAQAQGRRINLRYSEPRLADLYLPLGFEPVGRELVFYRGA
ncbi:MAG TPA: GNAT family N-acetyltransferase [Candidatus Dormibacteraeota bacterium]